MATQIGALSREVARTDSWWRGSGWEAREPDLLEAARSGLDYQPDALSGLESGCLYILRGPRRVGTTVALKVLVRRLIAEGVPPTSIVRVAVDGWAARNLRNLTRHVSLPPSPTEEAGRYWLIDEVTAVSDDWAAQIKWLRGPRPRVCEVDGPFDGLECQPSDGGCGRPAGRRGRGVRLDPTPLPMGFRTFAQYLLGDDAPDVAQPPVAGLKGVPAKRTYQSSVPWLDGLVRGWELYSGCGGYPVAVEMAVLERLWDTISGFAVSSRIGADLGASHEVVARQVDYLGNACPPVDLSPEGRQSLGCQAAGTGQDLRLRSSGRPNCPPARSRTPPYRPDRADGDAVGQRDPPADIGRGRAYAGRSLPLSCADESPFHVRTKTRKEIGFVNDHLGGVAIKGNHTEGRRRSGAATVEASEWSGLLETPDLREIPRKSDAAWAVRPACWRRRWTASRGANTPGGRRTRTRGMSLSASEVYDAGLALPPSVRKDAALRLPGSILLEVTAAGGSGTVTGCGAVCPGPWARWRDAADATERLAAQRTIERIVPALGPSIANLKRALDLQGPRGGACRMSIDPPTSATERAVAAVVEDARAYAR